MAIRDFNPYEPVLPSEIRMANEEMLRRSQQEVDALRSTIQRLEKQIRALLTVIELLGEKEHADKAPS